MFLFVLGVAATALFLLYLYLTWNYNYWKDLGIPYDQPKLFFGSIKETLLGRKHFGIVATDIYNKFPDAAYVGMYMLKSPVLLIRDLDLTKDVMVKEFHSFEQNAFEIDTKDDPLLTVNPFFHSGAEWKRRRAEWSANQTLSKVKFLYEIMDEKQKIMIDYLNKHVEEKPGEPLEARDIVLKYLTDVMVHGTMGIQSNAFEDEKNMFKKIAESIFVSSHLDNLSLLAFMLAPWLRQILPTSFLKGWVQKECKEIARNVIALRKEHGFLRSDFFESLMKDDKVDLDEVSGRVFGFLSDGVETSSGLIAFTLFELGSNPQIQAKLRKELDELAKANGGKLNYDAITNNKYLDNITSEVQRIYPAVLTYTRLCTKPITFPPALAGGKPFTVPVGTAVTICNYATQMDSKYFPDPEKFDPERFANDIPKFAYLPFGEGPRICVGMKLGLTNSKTAVANIIRNFEIRVAPKTQKKPLEVDPNVLVCRAVGGLWITFHKIKEE